MQKLSIKSHTMRDLACMSSSSPYCSAVAELCEEVLFIRQWTMLIKDNATYFNPCHLFSSVLNFDMEMGLTNIVFVDMQPFT